MYFKNIRGNHYRRGYLQVPEGYSHLKANSAQRNPSASHIKKVKAVMLKRQEARARKAASKRAAEAEEPATEGTDDHNPTGQDSEEMQVMKRTITSLWMLREVKTTMVESENELYGVCLIPRKHY